MRVITNQRIVLTGFIAALLTTGLCSCSPPSDRSTHPLHRYDYRDTRQLVSLLLRAQQLLETEGTNAFKHFSQKDLDWTYRDAYLYVYATNGVCLYHAGIPELEGQQLMELTDAGGRKTLRNAFEAVANEDNDHGWVHYWWNIPNRLYPVWKSSCHALVTMPDGEQVLLGTGMAHLSRERAFMRVIVDSAAHALETQGLEALEKIKDPLSHYFLPGSPIFVITKQGDTLLSPSFHIGESINIIDYEDDAGHTPLRTAIERLETTNSTWVILLTHSPESMNMHKKGLYIRNVQMGTNTILVGATADLPKPSWMD